MCGRFSRFTGQDVIINRFGVDSARSTSNNSYNIAPSTDVSVIFRENPITMDSMRWGYIPFYADDISNSPTPINARDDSLDKSMYKHSLQNRRVIIPANGFYEWKKMPGHKQPFHIHLPDMEVFGFGGIYSMWKNSEGKEIRSFAIITTSPNEQIESIHDRMPLILNKEDEKKWLDYDIAISEVRSLIKPYDGLLEVDPVSTLVNSPKNDNSSCIEPISENDFGKEEDQSSLDEFF